MTHEDREFLTFLEKERRRGARLVAFWIVILAIVSTVVMWGVVLACDKVAGIIASAVVGIMP
jgi:hypothetical protein